MSNIIRLILLIVSIIVTLLLFIYHLISFYKYTKKGKYQYESVNDQTYMVVKEGFSVNNCTVTGTTYTYGEVDWLIIRSQGHFLFLFCFWGALMLAFVNSIVGSILEYRFNQSIHCGSKFLRILRSTLYKSSMSVPIMLLFAFNYATPCLELRKTTLMLFSNSFAYITVAIQFPVLIVVFLDIIYEYYVWKPNATYILVKGSIKNQPLHKKVIQIIVYSILFIIIISGILLSFLIYLELLWLTHISHHILVVFNILLSVLIICYT